MHGRHIKKKPRSNKKKAIEGTTIAKAVTTTAMVMVMRSHNSHRRKRCVTVVAKQDTWHRIVQRERNQTQE